MIRILGAVLTAALMSACSVAFAADPVSEKPIVYLGASLIDGTGAGLKRDMAIVTQGARIVAVQPARGFTAPANAEVIDIHGKFIIPGLINSHVHLATVADPPDAKAYLRRDLYSGVTTVRDMAGDTRLLGELKREAEFDEIPSPDIYYAALMAGPEFFKDPRVAQATRGRTPGEVPWMQAITAQTNMPLAIAAAKGTGATAIKIYADLPAPLVSAITVEAHKQGMLVWAHAAVFPARPSDDVGAGVDVMSHACMLGYQVSNPMPAEYHNRAPVDAAKLAQPNAEMNQLFAGMKRNGTILDATVYVYEEMWRIPNANPPPYCTLALAEEITSEAYRADIPISTGTDGEADWKDNYSAIDSELELLVNKAGMTPLDAIRSATLVGARTVGQEASIGTVEAGKLANFVVLEKNPLDNISNVRSVSVTVKHGIRYPRSEYVPITKDEVKNEQE